MLSKMWAAAAGQRRYLRRCWVAIDDGGAQVINHRRSLFKRYRYLLLLLADLASLGALQ